MLEEKLAAREGDDPDDEIELAPLQQERLAALRWTGPRAAAARAGKAGLAVLLFTLVGAWTIPGSVASRGPVIAAVAAALAAVVVFWTGVSDRRRRVSAVDVKIAAARERIHEARRLRSLERELRAARERPDAPPAAPRLAVDAEPEEAPEADEAVSPRRASR
jgi:hypothetical protein